MSELSDIKRGIITELLRMEEDCTYSSKSHFNSAEILRNLYYWFGIPLVIFTAITTKYYIACVAIVTFILTAIQTFVNPYKLSQNHKIAGNTYLELKNKIRGFYTYEIYELSDEDAIHNINCLKDGINKINKTSPIPLNSGFKKAIEGIQKGEAEYKVDIKEEKQ